MDLIKIGIIVIAWLIITLLLAVIIPPFKENTNYSCVFDSEGICKYPQDANMAFWGCFAVLSFLAIVIAAIQFTSEAQNAYIMTLSEAWNKLSLSTCIQHNLPPVSMLVPEMTRDVEGGKKKLIAFYNPFDSNRRNWVLLNMMSDYNTTTTALKQVDPLISHTRQPMSIPMAKSMLYSPDRDPVTRVAQLERTLERQGLASGSVRDMFEEKVQAEKDKIKQQV
jgi:hypothetical protein